MAWRVAYAGEAVHPGNALFRASAGRVGATLYFSPEAGELAQVFGARRCTVPPPGQLCLIAGDARAWRLHFPEAPARVLIPDRSLASEAAIEPDASTVPMNTSQPGYGPGALFAPTQPLG